jgi:hypothetical protein
MKTFCITEDNQVRMVTSERGAPSGTETFRNEKELGGLAEHWPTSRLAGIWNQLAGVRKVAKFTDRKTGVRRLWQALEAGDAKQPKQRRRGGKQWGQATPKPSQARTRRKTKTERILALLDRPAGATLQTLMKVTEWQAHSVRGFLSAQVTKRMGLKVNSFRREDQRVYSIQR